MRRLVLCFAALLPLAMTAACGQNGALYLPPKNGTVVTRPAGAPTSAAFANCPSCRPYRLVAGSTARSIPARLRVLALLLPGA